MFLWIDDYSGILFFYDEETGKMTKILITYLDFIEYLKTLAADHVDMAHGKNGIEAVTEFTSDFLSALSRNTELHTKHLLWGAPEIADASTSADNSFDGWNADILVVDRFSSPTEKYDKISESIQILQEFRARFKQDGKVDPNNWIKLFDHSSIRIHPMELPGHGLAGARMEFKLRVANNLIPDPEKWQSL